MNDPKQPVPNVDPELFIRIGLVRRDMSNLLFHFTRATPEKRAMDIVHKILREGKLTGTSNWTLGTDCVCFTEAPITEFASIFSLVKIASTAEQRPRYEPYGIAVTKEWLFQQGGRPVIYDRDSDCDNYPVEKRYRLVPFDLQEGVDFTWEREWRIATSGLVLDPRRTLVVVPTASEAFDVMDASVVDVEGEGTTGAPQGFKGSPKWMAVSLDLFGFKVGA